MLKEMGFALFIKKLCNYSRDQLKRQYNRREYWIEIDLDDLSSFDSTLTDKLTKLPADYVPLVNVVIVHFDLLNSVFQL